jgi:phenylalanyl-tRNA synthetase beta chain
VIPSLLEVRRRNVDAGLAELRLFESARAFRLRADGAHDERATFTLLSDRPAGPEDAMRWMRGTCERILRTLAGEHAAIRVAAPDARAPWYADEARIACDGRPIGAYGLVAPAAAAAFGIEGTLCAAELELEPLWHGYPPEARAEALPSFPAIERDLSAIVDERTRWEDLDALARSLSLANLERVDFVGTYRGAQTGTGRKSVTMRLSFRAPDRTLRREDADGAMSALAEALTGRLGAVIRG